MIEFNSVDVEKLLERAEWFVPAKDRWLVFFDRILFYGSIGWPLFMTHLLFIALKKQNELLVPFEINSLWITVLKMFWLTGIVFVTTNTLGLLFGGAPEAKNQKNKMVFKNLGWPKKTLVICWVSRGQNYIALERAVANSLVTLKKLGVKYEIEIVTDMPVAQHHAQLIGENVTYIVVPCGYKTKKKALYKARALQYALRSRKDRHAQAEITPSEYKTYKKALYKARALQYALRSRKDSHAQATGEYWVLHLDEESQVTESLVYGIAKFISDPDNQNTIGQGEIKYNGHNYGENLLVTAVDSVRTGDDLGRFRMQFKFAKRPLFGMHGSFILCPEEIENDVEFDLGGKGSITEDAYFALTAQERGVKFGWVDGHIIEQSPFTLKELMMQRKRWIDGLKLLSKDTVLRTKTRLPLMTILLLWRLSFISSIATILNVMFGGVYFPEWALLFASITLGIMIAVYTIGAYRNLFDSKKVCTAKKVFLYFLPASLIFFVGIIEGMAVLWSLFSPTKGFDVVAKN